jgi:hypothetical protein
LDNGATWKAAAKSGKTEIRLAGLVDGTKVHVRGIAVNAEHESAAGPEYPVYVTKMPPPAPDGLRVSLAKGAAALSWGEVLGVSEYRLHGRTKGEKEASRDRGVCGYRSERQWRKREVLRRRYRSFVVEELGSNAGRTVPACRRIRSRDSTIGEPVGALLSRLREWC